MSCPDQFFDAYVVAALWSSTDDDSEPMDKKYTRDDIAPEALAEMREDCDNFWTAELAQLTQAFGLYAIHGDWTVYEQAGHDFWLTRNHHGAGFWDRGLGDVGDQLTKAAQVYGGCDLYVGDDGKVYV